MAEKEDRLDISISTIIAAMVSLLIIAYVVVPTISDAIKANLTGDLAKYGDLMELTLILMIIGVIVFIVRGYNSRGR